MWRRLRALSWVVVLALALLVGVACGGGSKLATRPEGTGPAGGRLVPAGPTLGAKQPSPGGFELLRVGERIIKTASVTLEIKHGTFGERVQAVTEVAGRHGGFVASSRISGSKYLSGTIVLRIPASQFEAALGEVLALGTMKAEQISGQDVTAQFVDLQARLRNWEAQEDVLLGLMGKSASIADSLKVQQALEGVQLNIEEIKGQLRVLGDQTDLSTITLSMAERVPVALVPKRPNPFIRSWRAAVDGTVAVFTAVIIGLGFMVPVFMVTLAVGLGWLVFRRIRAKTVASA